MNTQTIKIERAEGGWEKQERESGRKDYRIIYVSRLAKSASGNQKFVVIATLDASTYIQVDASNYKKAVDCSDSEILAALRNGG